MPDRDLEQVRAEVERLHRFLSDWLNGTLEQTDDAFAEGIESRLHSAFINIQPAGIVLTRDTLLHQLRSGWGGSPAFRIRVRNVALMPVLDSSHALVATYEEYQRGARNSARAENARLSTALFARDATGALQWLHVHETWMPEDAHAPARFDF